VFYSQVSEMSNSLSIINIPRRLSRDFMGFLPPTIEPEFVGTLVDNRLEGAYAVGVNGMNAYVASRWCKTCVVLVSLEDPVSAFSLIFVWAMRLMACFFLINRVIPWSAASSRDPVCSVSSTSWSRRRSPSRGSRSGHLCVVWSSWLKAWKRTARSRLSPPSLTGGEFISIYVWAIGLTMFFCQQGHHR